MTKLAADGTIGHSRLTLVSRTVAVTPVGAGGGTAAYGMANTEPFDSMMMRNNSLVSTVSPEPAPEPADISALTKAVVANCVVLVPGSGVGAVGVPMKVGESNGALSARSTVAAIVLPPTVVSGGSATGPVTVPPPLNDMASDLTMRLIRRRWSSPSANQSVPAGQLAFRLAMVVPVSRAI